MTASSALLCRGCVVAEGWGPCSGGSSDGDVDGAASPSSATNAATESGGPGAAAGGSDAHGASPLSP